MARRSTRRSKSTTRRTSSYRRGSAARSTSRRSYSRAAPRRRARASVPRQQRIVIEFAGAAPARETGIGLTSKPAPAARIKPKL